MRCQGLTGSASLAKYERELQDSRNMAGFTNVLVMMRPERRGEGKAFTSLARNFVKGV